MVACDLSSVAHLSENRRQADSNARWVITRVLVRPMPILLSTCSGAVCPTLQVGTGASSGTHPEDGAPDEVRATDLTRSAHIANDLSSVAHLSENRRQADSNARWVITDVGYGKFACFQAVERILLSTSASPRPTHNRLQYNKFPPNTSLRQFSEPRPV
jgi:hypothetical protein